MILTGVHPGDRRRDRRGAGPRRRAAVVRGGAGQPAPVVPRRRVRPAVRPGHQAPAPRASATTRPSSTTSCASTAVTCVTDLLGADRRAGRHPVGEPRRGGHHRPARGRAAGACRGSTVDGSGDNLVARTDLGRSQRLVLAGHTDTVPANGNERARIDGDVLWGLGACRHEGGPGRACSSWPRTVAEPAVDVTYVFYECEEVDAAAQRAEASCSHERPDLLAGDAAILGEPTGARDRGRLPGDAAGRR